MSNRTATVQKMFDAYMARDWSTVDALFAPDFRFTSQYDDAIDKATYKERCWPLHGKTGLTVERVAESGANAVFVTYLIETDDKRTIRNTEYWTFAGDRIASVDVYFGATYQDGVHQPAKAT